MRLFQLLLPISLLVTFSAASQDTITYAHCNCTDIIETLEPIPSGSYSRVCDGVMIEQGDFKTGLKIGEWTSYSSSGKVIKKINYTNGTLNGDVSYFHNNGKKKLSGSFSNGKKNGNWAFYNQKEKIQWSLTYRDGLPVGKSLIYDRKGKKVVVSYDFDKNEFAKNSSSFSLFEDAAEILQDPTSAEWFILFLTDPTAKTIKMSLDQKNIESELFMSLIEIPSEFLNTYLNVNYNVKLTFERNGLKSIDLKREAANGDDYPMFTFAVMTNDPELLRKIDPSEFSLKLLDSKIEEALSIFTPWQIENGEFNMAFIYVINQIEGREEIDQY